VYCSLNSSPTQTSASQPLVLKNIQMYAWGVCFGLSQMLACNLQKENSGINPSARHTSNTTLAPKCGFEGVFHSRVLAVSGLKALQGLTIALVMKYGDNVVKCYASAASMLCTVFLSWLFFDKHLSFHFFLGGSTVLLSFYLFFGPHVETLRTKGKRPLALSSDSDTCVRP